MVHLCQAQEVPKIIEFKRSDYNSGHQNWMIAQGCEGDIYIANTGGLLIYNGFLWQNVSMPDNQKVRAVLNDSCKMYVAGYGFFGYIDTSNPNVPQYIPIADELVQADDQEIWMIIAKEGKIYFQSFSTIYIYDGKEVKKMIPPTNVMLGDALDDTVIIPMIESGLYKIENEFISEYKTNVPFPENCKISALVYDKEKDAILIGTQHNGIFYLQDGNLNVLESSIQENLKVEQINKMILMDNGNLVVGTIRNGVYILDENLEAKYHINRESGLANNTVLSLFQDKIGDVWVGMDKGINILKLSEDEVFYYDIDGRLGTLFAQENFEGRQYIGTNQGVFVRDNSRQEFELINGTQGQAWSFFVVGDQLLCGHNDGTYRIEGRKATLICDVTGGWDMTLLPNGKMLQSTYTGLILMKFESGTWKLDQRISGGVPQIEIFLLHDHLLTGYHPNYGIIRAALSENYSSIEHLEYFNTTEKGEKISNVYLLDDASRAYIYMEGKIYTYEEGEIKEISQDQLTGLHVREQLNRIDYAEKLFVEENASPSVFVEISPQKGKMVLPMDNGFVYTDEFSKDTVPMPEIDYILIEGNVWNESITNIELGPYENDVTFQMRTSYYGVLTGKFDYQLKGWSEDWYPIPKNGKIDFNNLNDGKYIFKIKSNNDKRAINVLEFKIKPRWYESYLGVLLYLAIAGLLLIIASIRNRKKLKRETEKLRKEKERELAAQNMKAKNDELERELIYKSKMLANSALSLVQKNKVLNELKEKFQKYEVQKDETTKTKLLRLINRSINNDDDWQLFEKNFAEVHDDFLEKLKERYPTITAGELRLAAYIKMDLTSKEIAPLLNISVRSVENKRYRLRKKMEAEHDDNLKDLLLRI